MKPIIFLSFGLFNLVFSGCGFLGGTKMKSTTALKSSTLASTRISARSMGLSEAALTLNAALVSTNCSITGAVACITPTSVSGMAYYVGLMVGTQNGYSLGPILGTSEDPSQIKAFKLSDLYAFNMAEGLKNTGTPSCCGGSPYPSDSDASIQNVQIYFGYIDVIFELTAEDGASSNMVGKHSVRTVYGDVSDKGYIKGDLLYKGPSDSDFAWCDSTSCGQASRPSAPLQDSSLATFSNTNQGNKVIPTFTAKLVEGHESVFLTKADVTDTTKTWTYEIDFVMTNGVYFKATINTLTTAPLLVANTRLSAGFSSDSGFKARVKASSTTSTSTSTSVSSNTTTATATTSN